MRTVRITDNRLQVTAALNGKVLAFLEEAAGELESQVVRNTAVDTGSLKKSWGHVVAGDTAIVGSPLENAIWEEYGTGWYAVEGDGRKTPWHWKDRNGQWHTTYGKQPKRAFLRAGKTVMPKLAKRAKEVFGE